jgi:hypothetical protein
MAPRPVQVGISIIPDTDSLERSRALVRVADEGGLAFVGVQDHPYQHHVFEVTSRSTRRPERRVVTLARSGDC